jgi:hypothetical protein
MAEVRRDRKLEYSEAVLVGVSEGLRGDLGLRLTRIRKDTEEGVGYCRI